jgi:UDP-N-acetylmuramoyl-L-alanyl-D-glutamate--2,6-diaminopimelate ligase
MDPLLYQIKRLIPRSLFKILQPPYHLLLAYIGARRYNFPSKEITVIGVTGTKGKSSVVEILNALFEAAGKRTAVSGTIRFKIGDATERNLYKMTMPGRFFIHKFLREAVDEKCDVAIIEMTSEGARQFRHTFIDLDALVFTNLSPEHIESHGSFDNYLKAKLSIAEQLGKSSKRPRFIIANTDDEYGKLFLETKVEHALPFGLSDLTLYTLNRDDISFVVDSITMRAPLIGLFNVYNCLAAITAARAFGITLTTIEKALAHLSPIKGRVERFTSPVHADRHITVVVDYAHTPDSLEKLYTAFAGQTIYGILGNTGGGRDTWKRPEMGKIAGRHCAKIILTNEDPYDENPMTIVEQMAKGVENATKVQIIMDRRIAIRTAIQEATNGSVVIISGKGTDPYIMGPRNTKIPWSDAQVVREELATVFGAQGS